MIPDILYHGTSERRVERFRKAGFVQPGSGRQVFLSDSESEAWKVAHRFSQGPEVLYIDAGRARRTGLTIHRVREGLYVARQIPVRHVLNMRRGFREQLSAGGLLVRRDQGEPQVALVSCMRRSRATWEIAKGKLEDSETPEQAAMRELQEEMGFTSSLHITHNLGAVRYGFRTPEGEPRLKTLHVFLIEADPIPEDFQPAADEGIQEVRWFPISQAQRMVTHTSLVPLMAQVRRLLEREFLDAVEAEQQ
ncbi:MAG: NUDIX domain-containing protein [Alphaproteobacteria bacterium]|nr:NUDIX domain-containing protein [Alphaproteobacteria bacterium]